MDESIGGANGDDGGRAREDSRRCGACGQVKPVGQFYPRSDGKGYQRRCRACYSAGARALRDQKKAEREADPVAHRARIQAEGEALKAQMFAGYGSRCACCGEAHPAFLRIERVRREETPPGESNEMALWRKLRAAGWPDTHELLCANCSLGKIVGGGVCPHRLGF